ncbi:TetR/AcrR family transcriptional regulator, partial [Parasphingorhabdus sp.]|uniref:TetR/AcrR family transcriptional regulator n=1 Tax=Parasphingorhabdus sp. TaxID=2709688 RepID=UPI002F93D168
MSDASAKMVQSSKVPHMNKKEKTKKTDGRNRRGSSKIQAAKSEAMRQQLLQTTVTCYASMPYSEVSALLIAEKAGVSRGGMQYHFPTRLDMLQATVRYLHARRLEIFRNDLNSVPDGVHPVDHMVDSHWRNLNEAEFRAYQELVLAGRSEPELHKLLTSSYRAFINEWHEIAHSKFGWK